MVRIAPLSPTKPASADFAFESEKPSEETKTTTAPPVVVNETSKIFPSLRFFMALLLCMCFISLSVATSNLSVSMVCMIKKNSTEDGGSANITCPKKHVNEDGITVVPCRDRGKVEWTSTQQGFVFAAQNFGSLAMLFTGSHADKLNGKLTIAISLILLCVSNAAIPLVAETSVWLVFAFRVLAGVGDAFLFPSASSMIGRWFPPKERPFAIGFMTGGRQIGSLLILPVGGLLCSQTNDGYFSGWRAIFNLSAIIAAVILVVWLAASADKPSKHCCIGAREEEYVARKIEEESLGKRTERGRPPWRQILTSRPLLVGVAALVCHEYPLVIMLQLLPKYFSDVLQLSSTTNGLISALPIAVLWISKTLSSSLASLLTAKQKVNKTTSCKLFNLIASLGLGICVGITPFLAEAAHPAPAILVLCLANFFAGLHTPGVQTALVQIAPAFSGIVTGIAFSVVAAFSIMNKLLSNTIIATGSKDEWLVVFEISAVVALLPVVFFTAWGSAERQPWASREKRKEPDQKSESLSENTSIVALAKFTMYLSHEVVPT